MKRHLAGESRLHTVVRACLVVALAATAVLFWLPIGETVTRRISEASSLGMATLMLLVFGRAVRITRGSDRVAWLLILVPTALAMTLYAADPVDPNGALDGFSVAFHVGPWATIAQIVALVILSRRVVAHMSPVGLLLDASWLALAAFIVSWPIVGGPVLSHETMPSAAKFSLVAQSAVAAVLVGLLFALLFGATRSTRASLIVLIAEPFALAASQAVYGRHYVNGTLEYGTWGDFTFPLAFALMACTALLAGRTSNIRTTDRHQPSVPQVITWVPLLRGL